MGKKIQGYGDYTNNSELDRKGIDSTFRKTYIYKITENSRSRGFVSLLSLLFLYVKPITIFLVLSEWTNQENFQHRDCQKFFAEILHNKLFLHQPTLH